MEPGVANREGKGAIKRRRMRKVILQNSANPPDADHKVRRDSEPLRVSITSTEAGVWLPVALKAV